MKKKFTLVLTLVLVMAMTVPVFAKTELKELDNGKFEITWTYKGDLDAAEVFLAGKFNGWKASHPDWKMKKKDGAWKITKTMEKGEYPYKFVVNGSEWVKDNEAEKFVPDGYGGQNSVVVAISNKLKGEFKLSGSLENKFEQEGESADVTFDSQLDLRVQGTAAESKGEKTIERLKYDGTLRLESNIDNVEDINEMEIASLDKVNVRKLETTYLGNWANVTLRTENDDSMKPSTKTYDYLGLMTHGQDKDHAKNPNSFGDIRQLEVTANKGVDGRLAVNEYEDTKYLGYMDVKKTIGNFTVGSSVVSYQPKLLGKEEFNDRANYAALFGKYKPMKNLSIKGEYAYIPTGNIDQNSFTVTKTDNGYKITFNLETAVGAVGDFEDTEVSDYGNVVLIGEFNDWAKEPSRDYKYQLTDDNGDDIWTLEITDQSKIDELTDNAWKVVGVMEDPAEDDDFDFAPSGTGNEKNLDQWYAKTHEKPAPLEDGKAYLAEATYKVIDQQASMKARVKAGDYSITKYKGEFSLGGKAVQDDAYLKVANDDLAEYTSTDPDEDSIGYKKIYANGEYDVLDNLTVDGDLLYQTGYEGDVDVHKKVKTGIDWSKPITGLDKVKAHAKVDSEDTDDFEGEVQELFVEGETSVIPAVKNLKLNTTQRLDSEVNEYYVQTELDIPVEQIAHIKGNVHYADDEVTGFEDDNALKYFVEGKVHHLPAIEDYVTHLLVNYKSDDNGDQGIVENSSYNDNDDNDWKNKFYAETKFRLPMLSNWDGVTMKANVRQIEDDDTDYIPEDINEDEQYYVAEEQQFVDLYSLAIFETGYDLPFKTRADLTVKYDLNHGEISEYEDDALLVEMEKELNMRTKLTASYNKQDDQHDDKQYSKLMVKTTF